MKTMTRERVKKPISVAEMQALEAAAFEGGLLSSRQAMETAGRGVAKTVVDLIGKDAGPQEALVLCGPGNNGGDGYVVARLLHDEGWSVRVCAVGVPGDGAPDAAANRAAWLERGEISDLVSDLISGLPEAIDPAVIVDALFGIGLTRGISGDLARVLHTLMTRWPLDRVPRVAVDVPSGLNADRGDALGAVLPASVSVTFHRPKPVHLTRPDLCGRVQVVDIGL